MECTIKAIFFNIYNKGEFMNILTQKEMLIGSALKSFIKTIEHESKVFNDLKGKYPTFGSFKRKVKKNNGKSYVEQLVSNGKGGYHIQMVRLDKVLSKKFSEQTLGLPVLCGL